MAISTEGKIGIGLGLVALLGAGAIMVAPQELWIGWTLIVGAIVGLVGLGIYHVSSVVGPPAQTRPKQMNLADAAFGTGIVAALVAAVAAILRFRAVAGIAAIIACAAVTLDFADRRGTFEGPLIPARMELEPIQMRAVADSVHLDAWARNNGTISAIGIHWESKGIVVDKPYTAAEINANFEYLKTLAKEGDAKNFDAEIQPGELNWITLPDAIAKDQFLKATATDASKSLYIFVLLKYRDKTLPNDKWVATEACLYTYQSAALHLCDHHNRVRIDD